MAIEELGPTFIKFGQILSNRPDLIPRELQEELEKLQENVAPFPAEEAIEIVERELGAGVDTLFHSFDREPFAAASIAQIHRAVLPDGREAAVKVQRPGLLDMVEIDADIFRDLAALIERRFPEAVHVGPRELVAEFERAMRQELDFRRETASIDRFAAQFEDDDRLMIPHVYRELSGRRVITMEYIKGRPGGSETVRLQGLRHRPQHRAGHSRADRPLPEHPGRRFFLHLSPGGPRGDPRQQGAAALSRPLSPG
jgi:ubiquinone biosynthesis protein